MAIFQIRIVQTLGALLALLVFGGDVLDDVWDVAGHSVAGHVSHSSDQTKGNAPKAGTAGHDDTTAISPTLAAPIPAQPSVFEYFDLDEAAPVGAPPAIDHPPQLA